MGIFQNLPEEVVLMIFRNLEFRHLRQVQKVCRDWYIPAHVSLLGEIYFNTDDEIERFIASIDHNPNPLYLTAVKKLTFEYIGIEENCRIYNVETLNKLFFRFPNLQEVDITDAEGLCDEFNDDLCKEFLECCPKLEKFAYSRIDTEKKRHLNILWKLRPLITKLTLGTIEPNRATIDNTARYVDSFPRLNRIEETCFHVDKFQGTLPFFDKVNHLTEAEVYCDRDDDEDFVENYLETKSNTNQDEFSRKLSSIKRLVWANDGFGLNSAKFISKYLTGLEIFVFRSSKLDARWTKKEISVFCNEVMDLVKSMKDSGMVRLHKLSVKTLKRCLPAVMQKMYQQTSVAKIRKFNVAVNHKLGRKRTNLEIKADRTHTVHVTISNKHSVDKIMTDLCIQDISALNNIDEFELQFHAKRRPYYDLETNVDMYDKMLERMPSLKKLTLDIPESFKDIASSRSTAGQQYPLMEELVLRATENIPFQQLLKLCHYSFPNIKKLGFLFFCGVWEEDMNEFQIRLANFSLESLKIDMTPIEKETARHFDRKLNMNQDYFVLDVEILNNSKRYLYKATFDLSSIKLVKDADLDGFTRGKDYLRVHITVKDIKRIDICLSHEPDRLYNENVPQYMRFIEYKNILNDMGPINI